MSSYIWPLIVINLDIGKNNQNLKSHLFTRLKEQNWSARWLDSLANFEPLRFDFNCVKHSQGKTVDLGGVFCPFGGLMGFLGSRLGDMAPWDVDEAQGCGGWIVWKILGRFDLTLTA